MTNLIKDREGKQRAKMMDGGDSSPLRLVHKKLMEGESSFKATTGEQHH